MTATLEEIINEGLRGGKFYRFLIPLLLEFMLVKYEKSKLADV